MSSSGHQTRPEPGMGWVPRHTSLHLVLWMVLGTSWPCTYQLQNPYLRPVAAYMQSRRYPCYSTLLHLMPVHYVWTIYTPSHIYLGCTYIQHFAFSIISVLSRFHALHSCTHTNIQTYTHTIHLEALASSEAFRRNSNKNRRCFPSQPWE